MATLLLVLSSASVFAGALILDNKEVTTALFDTSGTYVQDASILETYWTAVTFQKGNSLSSDSLHVELGSFSVLALREDSEGELLFLLEGTATVSSLFRETRISTPSLRIEISENSQVTIVSTEDTENLRVSAGSILVEDLITGETFTLTSDQPLNSQPKAMEEPALPVEEEAAPEEPKSDIMEQQAEDSLQVTEEVQEQTTEKEQELTSQTPVNQEPTVQETRKNTDIVSTTIGKGFNYGIKAHIFVPKLNLELSSPENARRVRNSLENTDFNVGFFVSYNSLRLSLRFDQVNIKPESYKISSSVYPVFQAIKLGASFLEELSYGSKGTKFWFKADRNTDLEFTHPMFGQMDHSFNNNSELAIETAGKTDLLEYEIFADNLSMCHAWNGNLGMRIAVHPLEGASFMAGVGVLASSETRNPKSFTFFPSLDLSFKIFHNRVLKANLMFYGTVASSSIYKAAFGTYLKAESDSFTLKLGCDLNSNSFLSGIVDYGNDTCKISDIDTDYEIINTYAAFDLKLKETNMSLYANIPLLKSGELYLDDRLPQDFSFKLSHTTGKSTFWGKMKLSNLFCAINNSLDAPEELVSNILTTSEILSLGADFDFEFAVINMELSYDRNMDCPINFSVGGTLTIDRRLFSK